MNLLTQVRQQYMTLTRPKAISHRPDLEGRVHIYRQGANQIVQAMDTYADYAAVYEVYGWVQKAIGKIAENLAGLPVRVADGSDKALESHPISELLANVNEEQTPLDLWGAYTVNMMLGGEAFYQLIPSRSGRPVEIWMRRPDRTAVVPDASRLPYPMAMGYIYEPEEAAAQPITIEAQWMVHDKFFNPLNPWRGLAPINAVRQGITIDMFAQAWSKSFLRNNTRPDFAIVAPQGITKTEKERYLEDFALRHRGTDKAHEPVLLEDGVTDIKVLSFPPKDIEWLQQREFSRDEVGAIFGVPDEIMGYGKDTYENFQTALEVFWTLTMLPLIRRRDGTLTHHFRRHGWLRPTERVATDLSGVGVLQEDLTPKVELARKFWEMGVPFNRIDEMLMLGVGAIEGGDVGYLAGTYKPIEQILEPPPMPPQLPPARGDGNPPPPDDDEPLPPQQRLYLPEGAKEQAKRALKRIIQGYQDGHLRALRNHQLWDWQEADDSELRRWIGDTAQGAMLALKLAIGSMGGDHDTVNAAYNALKSDESITRLLEVAAPAFFTRARVRLPDGPITHEAYKALLLQLDPDDDEAERAIREELEGRLERQLYGAFREQLGELLPDDAGDDVIRSAPARVDATSEPVREVLRRELEASSSLGVTVALDTLQGVGIGFDWTLAHAEAARWASRYSFELVRGINATSQARLQQAIDDWFRERTTLPDLVRELSPTFGRRRARLIAQTETTRAAREGSILGYEQSGVVSEVEWVTVVDERVCPTCGGLHGKRAPLRGTFEGGQSQPPAHPGCRCFVRPVINEGG